MRRSSQTFIQQLPRPHSTSHGRASVHLTQSKACTQERSLIYWDISGFVVPVPFSQLMFELLQALLKCHAHHWILPSIFIHVTIAEQDEYSCHSFQKRETTQVQYFESLPKLRYLRSVHFFLPFSSKFQTPRFCQIFCRHNWSSVFTNWSRFTTLTTGNLEWASFSPATESLKWQCTPILPISYRSLSNAYTNHRPIMTSELLM